MGKETEDIKHLPLPPGSFGLPLLGEGINFLLEQKFAEKRFNKSGNIFKTQILTQPALFTWGSENNRFFLMNENVQVKLPPSMEALLGPSALSVQIGEIHKNRRQILYEAFQPRALSSYFQTMKEITQNYLEYWGEKETIVWYSQIQNYTFDLAFKFLIGLDQASLSPFKPLYDTWLKGFFSFHTFKLPWTRFGKAWRSRQELKKRLRQIIFMRLKMAELGEDALGIMLKSKDESGQPLSIDEISDQLLGLLFAGYSTLNSALASFCLVMVQNPEVLKKVREEQQKFPQEITPEQLKEMPYLSQVMKELLRTNTPVGSGFRQVISDCELNGYYIPKGWLVFYQITQTHLDEQVYTNPEKFDPERFDETRAEGKKPFSYLPFGGGIRECLGKEFARLEMKTFAAMLTRHYQWELLTNQNLELEFIPVPQPKDGLKVKIQPLSRNKNINYD